MLLLLKLHGAHPSDSLFTFNALLLACLEDLFVFDSESPTLDVEAVEGGDDGICIGGVAEVCKSEATKSTCLVEMIVEGIGKGDAQRLLEDRIRMRKKREKKRTNHDREESFAGDIERNILDDDGRRDDFVDVGRVRRECGHRRRAGGREIGRGLRGAVEPLLQRRTQWGVWGTQANAPKATQHAHVSTQDTQRTLAPSLRKASESVSLSLLWSLSLL